MREIIDRAPFRSFNIIKRKRNPREVIVGINETKLHKECNKIAMEVRIQNRGNNKRSNIMNVSKYILTREDEIR